MKSCFLLEAPLLPINCFFFFHLLYISVSVNTEQLYFFFNHIISTSVILKRLFLLCKNI